jgi:nucleotide-binding universal stress UspA family protein
MNHASAVAPVIRPLPGINRILLATDLSACSKAAIPYACALARSYHARVHLLNVLGPQPLVGPMGVPYADPEQEHEASRRQLRALADCPEFRSIEKEYSVHRGKVPDVVGRIVEEDKIDLLVVGTHGRHGVKQFVMGSVAEQLFRHATCPVLTVGPGAARNIPHDAKFKRILLGTDFSSGSVNVVQYAESLARATDAALIIFHAIPDRRDASSQATFDDEIAAARKRIAELRPAGLSDVDTSLKIGRPAELIVETATERNADLIVIGARRGPRLASHVPWAVAHEVVCAAPCPVMTIAH